MSDNSQNTVVITSDTIRYIKSEYIFLLNRRSNECDLDLWIGSSHEGSYSLTVTLHTDTEEHCLKIMDFIAMSIITQGNHNPITINIPSILAACEDN